MLPQPSTPTGNSPQPSATPGAQSRAAAAGVLTRWIVHGDFPDRLPAGTPDRGFVMDLVYSVTRWKRTLEWATHPFLKREPEPPVRALLWLGAYQLLFDEAIPDHAAISATVAATRHTCRRATGYVNAVLRAVQRERESIRASLDRQSPGIRLSHPDLLIDRWLRAFGSAETEALCRWNNRPAHTVVTSLAGGPNATELLARFTAAGIDGARPHPAAPERCLILPRALRVNALPGFDHGDFMVQDPAALEAVRLLDPQPGLNVLDACAAPGGKAAQIAAAIGPSGRLTVLDRHADRLRLLKENFARLGNTAVRIVQTDAAACAVAALGGPFDRILIDAPCTNTGVLRRRPDARWRFDAERLKRLNVLQRRLVLNLLPALAPGGRLVYATCSLEAEENIELVDSVLAETPATVLLDTTFRHPVRDGTDGMFAAALV